MLCPYCSSKTRIYNSRSTHRQTQTWRRHRCTICNRTFTTRERIDWDGSINISSITDEVSPYSRERLLLSLVKASEELKLVPETLVNLCDSIEYQLQREQFFAQSPQQNSQITETAMMVLHRFDPNLALQYVNSVYSSKPPLELLKRLLAT